MSICQLSAEADVLILRSRNRRDDGRSVASIQGSLSGYGFHVLLPADFQPLTFGPSQDRDREQLQNASTRQYGGQQADA